MRVFRILSILALLVALFPASVRAGMNEDTKYTEKGQADFDTFLQLLNPYGTWSKIDGHWAYTPLDHGAPYTNGRWIYTEYGWMWLGHRPHSWATEHYGYWKRAANKIWSWYPGPFWLPETIEIRRTPEYIGWRSAQVDDDGGFVEAPIDRYTKPEEWNFVTAAQFANPVTPSILAPPDVARVQLESSVDCRHTYLTYREIDRPGPHPADLLPLVKVPGMLAPHTMEEEATLEAKSTTTPVPYAAHMTGTNGPVLLGSTADPTIDPNADRRKVKYWITMSLPTYWTKPPDDARNDQVYLYRPDMFQDQDGIKRRITLWFDPKARVALKDVLDESPSAISAPRSGKDLPLTAPPAIPAAPADADTEAAPGSNPFSSPMDQPFHNGKVTSDTPAPAVAPATNAAPSGPAPSGLK